MSEGIRKAIDELEERRHAQRSEIMRTERMINELLSVIGEPARYADAVTEDSPSTRTIKRGQFYGRPLATAVRDFLQTRKPVPATSEEIIAGLDAGDFDFVALNWKEDTRVRSLAMSLSKNTPVFHRLPSGAWGLKEWYPDLKARKVEKSKDGEPPADNGTETDGDAKGGAK